jgi:hypothetical protein
MRLESAPRHRVRLFGAQGVAGPELSLSRREALAVAMTARGLSADRADLMAACQRIAEEIEGL